MYELKLTILQQSILRFLFTYPEKSFTGRSLSRSLDVSQPGISKAIRGLKKESIITVQKDRETKRLKIMLNMDSDLVIGLKRSDNLRRVYESGLPNFLETNFPGSTIILFGSYSRGDDTSTSDVDIAIIGVKSKEIDFTEYEKLFKRKITAQFYTSILSVHKNLRNNLCSGIVLSGGVEL